MSPQTVGVKITVSTILGILFRNFLDPARLQRTDHLLNLTVRHGLGFANSLSSYFKGSSFVGCDALAVCAQVWLNLLPHLLFGVQLFIGLPCNKDIIVRN